MKDYFVVFKGKNSIGKQIKALPGGCCRFRRLARGWWWQSLLLGLNAGRTKFSFVIAEKIENCSAVFTKSHASSFARQKRVDLPSTRPIMLLHSVYQRKIASSYFPQ